MLKWLIRFGDGLETFDEKAREKFKPILNDNCNCIHNLVLDETYGEYVCDRCSVIFTNKPDFIFDKNHTVEFWPRQYARTQYFDALFDKIHGKERIKGSDQFIDELKDSMPNPGDWYQVYRKYKEWGVQEWWVGWNSICDYYTLNTQRIDMDPIHYKLMLYVDANWHNDTRSKKKFNVFYMLFKIVEMTGHNTNWVPMKLRPIALERLDQEWKEICKKFNWNFKPSNLTLKQIQWF